MPNSHEFIIDVNKLLAKLEESGDLAAGIDIANRIVKILGSEDATQSDLVIDEHVLQLPNAERYDHWFQNHPWMGGERAAFEITDAKDMPIQAKLYWLKKRSRQFIAGGVHFTENWEDADYTHNENFKIGIDFFLSPNGKSLLVALSNRGNIRVVELQHKLNNTQVEIFSKWRDAAQISSREALHNTLWESFKLQSVNKEFYTGVSNSFTELLQHLKSIGRDEEDVKLFASRLLGRLLFVWFLRKKSIIDESMGYFDASSADATTYYRQSLERLFFNTLNTPIDDRDEFKNETQKRLFPEVDSQPQAKLFQVDSRTPYLNGGLFEPHANDWYKDANLTLPEGFFTNLYDHFDQFNFTTDESSPEYEQVAIDPEMLGRVFESLLATQVDETGQQARKAKGAFYTPREIVSYMCRESLRNYLYGKHDDERYKKSVDELLDRSDHEWAGAGTNSRRDAVPKEYRTDIVEALDTVTILDPACGSGAFPMGMLQLLIKTYERLEGRFDPYKTKLQIVQNNIFGVDIEPMAVEISRLRAWLSLIVDEEESRDVAPLPNLDFKFVCANSLIPLDDSKADLFNDPELHKQLADIRQTYFNARKPHTKKAAQQKYYKLAGSNTGLFDNLRTTQLKSFDPFINAHPSEFFDIDQMFGIEKGFDIVIGNPPYVSVWNIDPQQKALFEKIYSTASGHYDLYVIFYDLGLRALKNDGILSFITSNKWMAQSYGKNLRKLFLENNLLNLIDFSAHQVFDSATVDTQITIIQKKHNTDDYNLKVYKHLKKSKPDMSTLSYVDLNTSVFRLNDELNFKINLTKSTIGIINRINSQSISLDKILYISKGAELHNTKKRIKKESFINDEPGVGLKKYIEGKYFTKYKITESKYLNYQPEEHKAPAFPELFESRKIIVKNVVGRGGIQAFLDAEQHYNNDAIINGVPYYLLKMLNYRQVKSMITDTVVLYSEEYPLEYCLGILNSAVSNWYFTEVFSNGLHFYPRHLKNTRIPIITESNQHISDQIVSIVKKINNTEIQKEEFESSLRFIDDLVFKAYGLTDEEIAHIKSQD